MAGNLTSHWHILASDIESTVEAAFRRCQPLADDTVQVRPYPGEWSVKEIFGHLVDSASNNHQRFVRLQTTDNLNFPDYSQDNEKWVSLQCYQTANWPYLLELWRFLNLHIAQIVRSVDQDCIDHVWVVDKDISYRLGDLMTDYLEHMRDHLQQITDIIGGVSRQGG